MWSFLSSGGPRLIVISSEGQFLRIPEGKNQLTPLPDRAGRLKLSLLHTVTMLRYVYTYLYTLHWHSVFAYTERPGLTCPRPRYHFSSMPLTLIITITPKHNCFAKPIYTNPVVYTFGTKTKKKTKRKIHWKFTYRHLWSFSFCFTNADWQLSGWSVSCDYQSANQTLWGSV